MPEAASTTRARAAAAEPLADEQRAEALAFLAERPLHTVIMAGLMRQYGTEVPWPRGRFYACRDRRGRLEGVALVGRATVFEARTDSALAAFARQARLCPAVRMMMGEASGVESFWRHYAHAGGEPRRRTRESFYTFSRPAADGDAEGGLRRATLGDLDQIVAAHASMFKEESGVDPLAEDAEGFRRRCALRVERGKVWALIERGELIFKADVVTETPEAAYVEGVWVSPAHRLKGYGRRCWAALSRALLDGAPSFCGFVNAEDRVARAFYERVGGTLFGDYRKVYV